MEILGSGENVAAGFGSLSELLPYNDALQQGGACLLLNVEDGEARARLAREFYKLEFELMQAVGFGNGMQIENYVEIKLRNLAALHAEGVRVQSQAFQQKGGVH